MTTMECNSDSNGNFSSSVEQGTLNESMEDRDPEDAQQANISNHSLASDDLEKDLLNVSSDFLPAESPEKKLRSESDGNIGMEDLEQMMVEIGEIENSEETSPSKLQHFKTAISNRDSLIRRLSENLQQVYAQRAEDCQITSKLEEEMRGLRHQVKSAMEKAAKNKSYRSRYSLLEKERDELSSKFNIVSAQMQMRSDSLQEKDQDLQRLQAELLLQKQQFTSKISELVLTVEQSQANEKSAKEEVERLREEHSAEIKEVKTSFEMELAAQAERLEKEKLQLEDKFKIELLSSTAKLKEDQVAELDLLDQGLLGVREERNSLLEKITEMEKKEFSEAQNLMKEQGDLLEKAEKERLCLVAKMEFLERMYAEENSLRLSLEQSLCEVNSLLDQTEYNDVLPRGVRQSIESSLRSSESFSRRQSELRKTEDEAGLTPPNITQLCDDVGVEGEESLKQPLQQLVEESQLIANLKAEHEKEMSELRKYFENYCLEVEKRYRNEFEEHLSHQKNLLSSRPGNLPLSLDISQGQLDFSELESISPRSLDSSQLNSLGATSGTEGESYAKLRPQTKTLVTDSGAQRNPVLRVDPGDESNSSDEAGAEAAYRSAIVPNVVQTVDSATSTDPQQTLEGQRRPEDQREDNLRQAERIAVSNCIQPCCALPKTESTGFPSSQQIQCPSDRESLAVKGEDRLVQSLKEKILSLEKSLETYQRSEAEPVKPTSIVCQHCEDLNRALQETRLNHAKEIEELRINNKKQVEMAVENSRKKLEADHLQKFDAVSKQIQATQTADLDRVRSEMNEQHARELEKLRSEHERVLLDVREAHALELKELRRTSNSCQRDINEEQYELNLVKNLQKDLDKLEDERNHLRSMQSMMKCLVTDLALHYSLSEKQVRFLSDSAIFDSFFDSKCVNVEEEEGAGEIDPSTPLRWMTSVHSQPSREKVDRSSSEVSALRNCEAGDFTPNCSVLGTEELSNLMADGSLLSVMENSGEVYSELRKQVRRSNQVLQSLEPGALLKKLSGLLTPTETIESGNFVGLEAGRLEVEKARLELELTAARQRIQELELSGRSSIARSEVMSGFGGDVPDAEMSSSVDTESFLDLRERAARIITESEGEARPEHDRTIINVLGELLHYSDQLSNNAKIQVEDLSQQLDAADKQLRSTRQFLEEQAQEREAEREEWEKRLESLQVPSPRYNVGTETEDKEDLVDGHSDQAAHRGDKNTEEELSAAVEKIFQLREIIKTLETEVESKADGERSRARECDELRNALTESLLTQQAIQEELELIRSSSSDQEMIDLIEGLKEQLKSKTQELQKHRAAHQHLHDVKAHLRGLQERVIQSTRELENSVTGSFSAETSRSSSPTNVLQSGVSFEDIGLGGAGLEIEEVSRLERKLKILEKAELAAVGKVATMDAQIKSLESEIEKLKEQNASEAVEIDSLTKAKRNLEKELKASEEQIAQMKGELEKVKNLNLEDLQAENSALQEHVVSLQVQVSTLQVERQARKHRFSSKEESLDHVLIEKEKVEYHLEETLEKLRNVEMEKDLLIKRVAGMNSKVEELERDLETIQPKSHDDDVIDKLIRDKVELEDVNNKLLKELSQARAAELAAHKVQLPKLADDLLKEKNCEIDSLKQQVAQLLGSSSKGHMQSTPVSWTSNISRDSNVEQLRNAVHKLDTFPEISDVSNIRETMKRSTIEQNLDSMEDNSSKKTKQAASEILSGELKTLNNLKVLADNTIENSIGISVPNVEYTKTSCEGNSDASIKTDYQGNTLDKGKDALIAETECSSPLEYSFTEGFDYKQMYESKAEELEALSLVINHKEELVFELQDKLQEAENSASLLKNSVESLELKLQDEMRTSGNIRSQLQENVERLNSVTDKYEDSLQKIKDLESALLSRAEPNVAEEMKRLREELNDRVTGMENLHRIIEQNETELTKVNELKDSLIEKVTKKEEELRTVLSEKEDFNQLEQRLTEETKSLKSQKADLESELSRVTKEMSAIENVVKEMTVQFKKEVNNRDQEIIDLKSSLEKESMLVKDLRLRIQGLQKDQIKDAVQMNEPDGQSFEGNKCRNISTEKTFQSGSIDDLTTRVQRELDISLELDNTLLSQVLSGNSTLDLGEGEASEVQRLVRKIEQDGVRVLSLSERLFLTQHGKSSEECENKEIYKKYELLQFELEQERFVLKDLQRALDAEKTNLLETISKLTRERKLKADIEEELNQLQKEVRILRKPRKSFSLAAESDNEEFLNTIEAQKQQIESLEESLRMEKENFSQLQNVLSVERQRSRQEDSCQERRNNEDITELRSQLRAERRYREQLESKLSTGKSGEVAKLIINRLHTELDEERKRSKTLSMQIDNEKRKQSEVYRELKSETCHRSERPPEDMEDSLNRVWRCRELELERLIADLELRVEMMEREEETSKQLIQSLQYEVIEERERNKSGLSKDQVERMKQVNSFLEHNLKENGEMLQAISKLQEERQELKSKVMEYSQRLRGCSCQGLSDGRSELYSKFLRTESYRKALIWQKRYLLAQIAGGYFDRDVAMKVQREPLSPLQRFRAAAQVAVSLARMRYLVRRWRTGKRLGSAGSFRQRSLSSARSVASEASIHSRPDTLNLNTQHSPRTVEPRARVRRTSSLRERTVFRPSAESPSSVSSLGSSFHPPVITGRTPPTRDVVSDLQAKRGSDPGVGELPTRSIRRSLDNQFDPSAGAIQPDAGLRDPDLSAQLKDYLEKYKDLENQLGVKF